MNNRFTDKVVVITGAYGGIGKATAAMFAKEGAIMVLAGSRQEKLDELAAELNLAPDRYAAVACNVSSEDEVKHLFETALERFGRIDVAFNNAGIVGKVAPLQEFTGEDMEKVLNVNVMGVFYGIKYALKAMLPAKSGVIINTSSVAGYKGQPNTAAYVASKHAITGLTRAAAAENAGSGVRVCCVCPAPVDTGMMSKIEDDMSKMTGLDKKEMHAALADLPMGRYAKPEEVASAVLFLASEGASYINGTSLFIDGGFIGF